MDIFLCLHLASATHLLLGRVLALTVHEQDMCCPDWSHSQALYGRRCVAAAMGPSGTAVGGLHTCLPGRLLAFAVQVLHHEELD